MKDAVRWVINKLTDKQKLFLILLAFVGSIPVRTREHRMSLAAALECSERTIYRILAGLRASGRVEVSYFKLYRLAKSEVPILDKMRRIIESRVHFPYDETSKLIRENPLEPEYHIEPLNCPAKFGKKPDSFLPPCLTCPIDEECLKATQEAKRSGAAVG
ncbi:MAG: hypothetical protein ACLQPD_18255 [Desulfomonilaceae bacterium]